VADIRSEPRPASDRNRWPASHWNAWPASSESAFGPMRTVSGARVRLTNRRSPRRRQAATRNGAIFSLVRGAACHIEAVLRRAPRKLPPREGGHRPGAGAGLFPVCSSTDQGMLIRMCVACASVAKHTTGRAHPSVARQTQPLHPRPRVRQRRREGLGGGKKLDQDECDGILPQRRAPAASTPDSVAGEHRCLTS